MSVQTIVRDEMIEYWDRGFLAAEAKPGAFYDLKKLPAITQASHFRRMALLEALPLGDLRDKVCVDYGVGPWGFACIFPKLHDCREAIGIDLSPEAVRISERVSRDGTYAYGDRVRYLTSTGSKLELPDASVDVFFSGESIEHVFNVDAFLDEVYRVLTPGGRFIVTTPNADACLYKAHGERYCHNGEHVSLMTYAELRELMDARFEVVATKGFNGSFYRTFDDVADEAFAQRWCSSHEDRPDLATGVVLMATKKTGHRVRDVVETEFHHTSPAIVYSGAWDRCALHGPLTAACTANPASRLTLTWEGDGLVLFLWSHAWSSRVRMRLDGEETVRRIYSPIGGFLQHRWLDLAPGAHTLELSPDDGTEPESQGHSLLFWKALGLRRGASR
jgi:ubiquinone/menaquinone biosynthesis C-methylase UbiE